MSISNDKICPICKFQGLITWGNCRETLYSANKDSYVHLCYSHSVDLFKIGQINFIAKHYQAFKGYELLPQASFTANKLTWGSGFR